MSFLFVFSFDFKHKVLLFGKTIRKCHLVLYIMMTRTATYNNNNNTLQDLRLRSSYTALLL